MLMADGASQRDESNDIRIIEIKRKVTVISIVATSCNKNVYKMEQINHFMLDHIYHLVSSRRYAPSVQPKYFWPA